MICQCAEPDYVSNVKELLARLYVEFSLCFAFHNIAHIFTQVQTGGRRVWYLNSFITAVLLLDKHHVTSSDVNKQGSPILTA